MIYSLTLKSGLKFWIICFLGAAEIVCDDQQRSDSVRVVNFLLIPHGHCSNQGNLRTKQVPTNLLAENLRANYHSDHDGRIVWHFLN
ncbi:MAG: hypothetical protein ACI9J3_001201 [Parvicellaceae bacterium]|jgi:hypothetical protein